MSKLIKRNDEYKYISNNEIEYELLVGYTIGKEKHSSDTLFIMFYATENISDENLSEYTNRFGLSTFVNYCQLDGEKETDFLNQKTIDKYVSKFEIDNSAMIEYIKSKKKEKAMEELRKTLIALKEKIHELEYAIELKDDVIREYKKSLEGQIISDVQKKKTTMFSVTPDQFVAIHEDIICKALDYDKEKYGYTLEDLTDEEYTITWKGISTKMYCGAEISNTLMPAILECWEEQQGL